jgi:hypothetical protein
VEQAFLGRTPPLACRPSIQFSKSVVNAAWAANQPYCLSITNFGNAGDSGNLTGPSPSIPIPDWRGFERVHPKSSQIGVDFSVPALFLIRVIRVNPW